MTTRQLETALDCTRSGWHVFPIAVDAKLPLLPSVHAPGTGDRQACRGRCGRWGHGVHDATTDEATIERWWHCWPAANVGVACGPSELVVIDLDVPKGAEARPGSPGADALAALAAKHGAVVPPTYTVRTGSGGLHLYFRAPAATRLPNTVGRLGPHIDTRAAGGYVLAANAVVNGRRYELLRGTRPRELPSWLLALLAPRPEPARIGEPVRQGGGYAYAALRNELRSVLDAPEGQRNVTLNRAAFSLGTLVGAGALPHALVEEELVHAGEAVGLTAREVAATVASGLRAGAARPRRGGAA